MENLTQDGRPIQLIGPLSKDKLLLESFSGHEGISIPFHFDLILLSKNPSISPRDVVGQAATIRVELPGNQERFINGIVTSFTQSDLGHDDLATYQATLAPKLWMLTRNADCRIFQDKTVPEILTDILKENGILYSPDLLPLPKEGRYEKREYCVQYSETDFHFISRLMEEEGIFYFFEHQGPDKTKDTEDTEDTKKGKHTLVLADDPAKLSAVPFLEPGIDPKDEPKANYKGAASSAPDEETITSWTVAEEIRPDMYELRDFNFKSPNADLTVTAQTGQDATLEVYDFPGDYSTHDRGKQLVDVRMEEIETAKVVISGASTYRAFAAGFHFDLSGHFRKDWNAKRYLLTSVFHCFKQTGVFRSQNTQEKKETSRYTNTFQCIPNPNRYRPPRTTRVPLIPSTQTAIVVGADTGSNPKLPPPHTLKDEIYTDPYGRVKVRFHWDRTTKISGDNTCFIRVAQPWAGAGWGHQWIPRIGQEVVVTFLEGNVDRPLITGCVYNGNHPLPFNIPDEKNSMESCRMQSGIRTHSTPFDPEGANDRFHMLRFDDRRDHEQVFLRSQKRLDVRALASYYDTCGGDRNTLIGWKDDKGQGGDYNVTLGNDHQIHAQGGRYDRVEKVLNLTVVGDVVCDFQANQSTLVQTKSELNAKQVIIEASETISLKVGPSFILLGPDGVTIYGPQIKINSGGSGIATGDPSIEDPLDAAAADTGKPCNRLYSAQGGGGGRERKRRTLRSQHYIAPTPSGPPDTGVPDPCILYRLNSKFLIAQAIEYKMGPTPPVQSIKISGSVDPALILDFGQDSSFGTDRIPFYTSEYFLKIKMRSLLVPHARLFTDDKAKRLFNAFLSKKSTITMYSDPELDQAIEAAENFKTYPERTLNAPGKTFDPAKTRIHQALAAAGWDVNKLNNPAQGPAITDLVVPTFNTIGNIVNSLTLMMDTVQYVLVFVDQYEYDRCIDQYTITLIFELYDVFGLDDNDLKTWKASLEDSVTDGFMAWWQLQHQFAYAPLITKAVVTRKFTVSTR